MKRLLSRFWNNKKGVFGKEKAKESGSSNEAYLKTIQDHSKKMSRCMISMRNGAHVKMVGDAISSDAQRYMYILASRLTEALYGETLATVAGTPVQVKVLLVEAQDVPDWAPSASNIQYRILGEGLNSDWRSFVTADGRMFRFDTERFEEPTSMELSEAEASGIAGFNVKFMATVLTDQFETMWGWGIEAKANPENTVAETDAPDSIVVRLGGDNLPTGEVDDHDRLYGGSFESRGIKYRYHLVVTAVSEGNHPFREL